MTLGTLIPLGYVLYTHHIWEDWFITFRHSQNLCAGNGLVYNVGERVHGFTSPLGVLLPALCYLLTGEHSYLPALWLFRGLCIIAYVVAGIIILRGIGRDDPNQRWVRLFFAALYLLDVKAVAFTVNGMETAFMLCFLAWGISVLDKSDRRNWLARGCAWAGLMWTRPDGCIYIAALALAGWLFAPEHKRKVLVSLIKSGAVTTVLYLPWFAWAWSYYGSPVPQTVLAKAVVGSATFTQKLQEVYQFFPHKAALVFNTIYPDFWNGLPAWRVYFSYCAGIFCCIYWMLPLPDRVGRAASLCYFLLCLYFSYGFFVFPWYIPPVSLCGSIVLASGIFVLARMFLPGSSGNRLAASFVLVLICCATAGIFVMTTRLMRIQAVKVEMGNRARIGAWLKQRVGPQETVFLEPIGFIGYFSTAKIVDWPGLVSPDVVRLRKAKAIPGPAEMIKELQPEWTVLRPHEMGGLLGYDPVAVFDVRPTLERYASMPGFEYLLLDSTFVVLKKRSLHPYLSPEDLQTVNHYLYPMMETPPTRVSSSLDCHGDKCNGKAVLVVHPEGEMRFALPDGSQHLSGQFGIMPKAYETGNTDGVIFRAEYQPARGPVVVLFERQLSPKTNVADRGMQSLSIDLPPHCRGDIVLKTTNGPGMNTKWDWSYWTMVHIE
jgi:hypothetical protein